MRLYDLQQIYKQDQGEDSSSVNQLLDFYQKKYINRDIDISTYQKVFYLLHDQGAVSAHENRN